MAEQTTLIIEEFRSNGGRVGGFFEGAPLLLLHHTGAKTATERISPLMYQGLEEGYAIFASKEGAPNNPDWFHNLLANPDVTVEVGSETIEVTARVAEGEERGPIWTEQKANYPNFAEYEERTAREIPVVILEPR
jgi:deazaflavin-dependent oxidoreductase (nitroreductase family)